MNSAFHRLIAGMMLLGLFGLGSFGILALRKLERLTAIAQRTEQRLAELVAPLGHAAVDKGVEAIRGLDSDKLGRSAEDGVREVGNAAKRRLIDALDRPEGE